MQLLFDNVYRILPTKITPTKYSSLFVERAKGNLLFSCFATHSTIEGSFDDIEAKGGVALHLLGDMHFAASYSDDIHERFGVPTLCSEVEAPSVKRKVKQVQTFPFERHELAPGVVAIPTPGHRPGAVSYLVEVGKRKCLFAGDTIWHDGSNWRVYASKKNRKTMNETLERLSAESFDVLLANTEAKNATCHTELGDAERQELLEGLKQPL